MDSTVEPQLEFRQVSTADASGVYEFLSPFMEQGFLLKRDPTEVERLTENGFAVFHDARVIGFASVEVYSKKLAELQCLAVSADYRRMGIGRRLVKACCDLALEIGVQELMAISSSDEMFMACGFDYSLPNQKRALFFRPNEGS